MLEIVNNFINGEFAEPHNKKYLDIYLLPVLLPDALLPSTAIENLNFLIIYLNFPPNSFKVFKKFGKDVLTEFLS